MNSGPTAERVYDGLKRRIMAREFRPGDRLDPAALAETLASSVTPVRDALHLLSGEGLVTRRTGDGFHLPLLDEPGLSDLYAWSSEVLILATRAWAARGRVAAPTLRGASCDSAERTAAVFSNIVSLSLNAEHAHAIGSANDRLHAVRTAEPYVLGSSESELEAIQAVTVSADGRALRRLIAAYHRRRQRRSAEIVRAVYRAS